MQPLKAILPAPALVGSEMLAPPAAAAELKPFTTLHSPLVRLSDLFADAGPGADRVLGPGPAPGGRIVVEVPQLLAIARQFGADWRPSSPVDTAVLEWPGQPLPRDTVLAALRQALTDAGMAPDADIDLPAWDPPMVGHHASGGRATGLRRGFRPLSAVVTVPLDGREPVAARVSGEIQAMVELPVAIVRLMPDAVIGPADIRVARVRASATEGELVHQPEQAIGMAVRRTVVPGQPLRLADLIRPPLVQKGAVVMMALDQPGISHSGVGQALGAGALDERIRVPNPSSRAVIEAEVTGTNRVQVTPGSLPLAPTDFTRALALR
jgi:flagellar basal body P-ring formation protein FlgA